MASLKVASLFLTALFIFHTISVAARPGPAFISGSAAQNQPQVVEAEHDVGVEKSCEGVGEEECLMRRTLAAQIDYIYTQKHNP